MSSTLLDYFSVYPEYVAPFMHRQYELWSTQRPLTGLRVVHHLPLVQNTLLKIACLIQAGAEVTVTHPGSFCQSDPKAIAALEKAGVRYVEDLNSLKGEVFDLYFDCGAELFQHLGAPKLGAIELTGSGDQYYRQSELNFPVISTDATLTKQLENIFGCAESSQSAIAQLTGVNPAEKSWLIFGFGKIGRGLAYFCVQHQVPVVCVDICPKQRAAAVNLGLTAIDPRDTATLQKALATIDVVVTATGKKSLLDAYPHAWFAGKILANLGVYDEYGSQFTAEEVLNQKRAVNFVLQDPTPMKYIDPSFYLHNIVAIFFLESQLTPGVHDVPNELDERIINDWCTTHQFSREIIQNWFITQESMADRKPITLGADRNFLWSHSKLSAALEQNREIRFNL